jgi:hypothetical protein
MSASIVVASYADLDGLCLKAVRTGARRYVAELHKENQVLKSTNCSRLHQAQAWLVDSARGLSGNSASPINWRQVRLPLLPVIGVFFACLFVLYAAPTVLELLVLPYSGALVNVLIGDLTSYVVLFLLGHRRIATTIYLSSRIAEVLLLQYGLVGPDVMLWVTDAVPSLICAGILCTKVFFLPEEPRS